MKQNGVVWSQERRSYSLYFDLNIWFRARKVTGTFEKRASGPLGKSLQTRGNVLICYWRCLFCWFLGLKNRYFKNFKNFCWYPSNLYCNKIQLRIEKLRGPSSNRYCSCYEFAWLQTPVHFLTHAAFIKNEKSKDYCKANSEQRALLFHNNISAGHTSLLQAYTCYCDRCYFYQPFTFWRNTLEIATAWKWRFTQN